MLAAVMTAHESADATLAVPVSVRDLLPRDLPACTWSGSGIHLRHVERELGRAAAGEVDYLAVCTPVDLPVAIGGVDYQVSEGAGTLWQLAVLPALQSRGWEHCSSEPPSRGSGTGAFAGPSSPWRRTTLGLAPCTSGWATPLTAVSPMPGTRKDLTG